jgi:enoyl-CoA hydratase/carnithine racemase
MQSEILVERRDGGRIAIVTINRPYRRNACDLRAWTDLRDTFAGFAGDPSLRLAVLTGAAGQFCAGDDIIAFREVQSELAAADAYRARIQQAYAAVQSTPVPVVAAVSGNCVGGGLSLAMCCDFRVGDATTRAGVPVAKLGLMYPSIQLTRLTHLIGLSTARRWLYSGEMVGAEEAHAAGFLDTLVDGDTVEGALAFGAPMMESAPLSIAGIKLQLNAIAAGDLAAAEEVIAEATRRAEGSEDYRNATEAFAQKRKPVFTGR